ncbi:MAG: hypothetical protein NTY99_01405 [DPANN group archaeon]|nr:hypothetical protein [DPANN group archaeon]
MELADKIKQYKMPIAKGLLVGTAVALAGITIDSTLYNTSLYDIAVNSINRSVGWDILGALTGAYETLRSYSAQIREAVKGKRDD